ncbi:putative OmpL-like beta-barrel porin-2 [Mucilaginibacter auburnensis]|uniref:Putative OmpL-like beta-barrel porin-2 n=2 Tax=Mucilaginibacter auburnensis TaxID=1457233 RepID=A0A2H9VMM2_9SPHI|nr:putative OmpL-like beta-barrel porin-2 [Mucilaginibacter auburnensis]
MIAFGALTVKADKIGGTRELTMVADTGDTPLTISGSVDGYYKYDFAKSSQLGTSFATDHNSFSIGMVDIALKKTTGKTSFVGEIAFGPRGQYQSVPNGDGVALNANNSFHIQNLYVNYAATDALTLTMGYMGTFVGYEVISPAGNFNYSTSYMFTNGPFQNAGFKATYAFSSKASLMAGVFNDGWNVYTSMGKIDNFGAQLFVSPVEGWNAYFNVLTGPSAGRELDFTTAYQITSAFKLGLNAADYTLPSSAGKGGFSGVALYPQLAVSSAVTLGLRGEYFKVKTTDIAGFPGYSYVQAGTSVTALTATANIKSGGLTIIPEFRFDNGSANTWMNKSGMPTKKAAQALLAFVYAF